MMGYTLPECSEYPFAKICSPVSVIGGLCSFCGPKQAFHLYMLGQISEIILKRIWNPSFPSYNPAFANTLVHFFSQSLFDESIEIWVTRKDNMATLVPGKSALIHVRRTVTTCVPVALIHGPVVVTDFVQA